MVVTNFIPLRLEVIRGFDYSQQEDLKASEQDIQGNMDGWGFVKFLLN